VALPLLPMQADRWLPPLLRNQLSAPKDLVTMLDASTPLARTVVVPPQDVIEMPASDTVRRLIHDEVKYRLFSSSA